MMVKSSRKPACWVLFGLFIAFILALPAYISPDSMIQNGHMNDKTFNWFRWSPRSKLDDSTGSYSCPLKIYMYELPRKFNMGMLKKDKNQEIPWTNHVAPPWKQKFEVNKQHSVEYWLMVYLLDGWDRKDGKTAAVRVIDPEQADVFFVPFFSALSFNSHGHGMSEGAAADKRLQAGLVDILSKSKWWQASQGRDHILVAHHPNALRHYRDMLNQSIFIVADFGRYDKTVARLSKDVVAPYVHVLPSYDQDNPADPFSLRKTLLFFQGRIHRKGDGIVRTKLAELLANNSDVHYVDSLASAEAIATSTAGMRTSRFCLHPAGDTPSSCRLFDAIVSHCVPVIISDRIELPFEDDLNYKDFSIFFSSEESVKPGHLLRTLRSITRERWLRMWNALKTVSHHFEYQHPPKKDDAVNMIFKQVQHKVPALKLAIHRSPRLRIPDWV